MAASNPTTVRTSSFEWSSSDSRNWSISSYRTSRYPGITSLLSFSNPYGIKYTLSRSTVFHSSFSHEVCTIKNEYDFNNAWDIVTQSGLSQIVWSTWNISTTWVASPISLSAIHSSSNWCHQYLRPVLVQNTLLEWTTSYSRNWSISSFRTSRYPGITSLLSVSNPYGIEYTLVVGINFFERLLIIIIGRLRYSSYCEILKIDSNSFGTAHVAQNVPCDKKISHWHLHNVNVISFCRVDFELISLRYQRDVMCYLGEIKIWASQLNDIFELENKFEYIMVSILSMGSHINIIN